MYIFDFTHCKTEILYVSPIFRADRATLYPLFLANLSDCIASVRQGAAESLAKVIKTYGW